MLYKTADVDVLYSMMLCKLFYSMSKKETNADLLLSALDLIAISCEVGLALQTLFETIKTRLVQKHVHA